MRKLSDIYFQVFAMPLFDLMEKGLVKKLNVPSGLPLRLVVRTTYVGKYYSIFLVQPFTFYLNISLKLNINENLQLSHCSWL